MNCPECKTEIGGVTSLTDSGPPDDGSLSLCDNCWEVSMFMGGEIVSLSGEQLQEIYSDDVFRATYNKFLLALSGLALPCGCKIWNQIADHDGAWEKAFVIEVCEPGCEYVAATLQEADNQDKEVVMRRTRP